MGARSGGRRFKISFPEIELRPEYGGKRAIVVTSARPRGDTSDVVLCTCIDIDGKIHQNIPVSLRAIQAGAIKGTTFIEADDAGESPSGLVGFDGRPL